MLRLDTPLAQVDGLNRSLVRRLARPPFGLETVRDLLEHYPHQDRYSRLGAPTAVALARPGDDVTVIGTIVRWNVIRPKRRNLVIAKATVADEHGARLEVPFFNQEWRPRAHPVGTRVAVSGTVELFRKDKQLRSPRLVVLTDDGAELDLDIEPLYPASEDLGSRSIAAAVARVLDQLERVPDPLPGMVREPAALVDLDTALRDIHRPPSFEALDRARDRLVHDELFYLQLALQRRRHELVESAAGLVQAPVAAGLAERFVASLPFEPTADQLRAFAELDRDLAATQPMHRLLQGDVGTGKTIVAARTMLTALDHGRQAVLMAPTTVLAEQHARTFADLMAPLGLDAAGGPRLGLLTSGTTTAQRRRLLAEVAGGQVQLLVATHAVLEDVVEFADLGVVVIDEQHRFGVEHRRRLRDKRRDGATPDVLVMTATPIPRSLALALYGDLDVTTLRQRPGADEITVTTTVLHRSSPRRAKLYEFIRAEVAAGRRAYVVCPLIEPSDAETFDDVANATQVHVELSERVFPDIGVALVHGRMPAAERDAAMDAFRLGTKPILVATTVIEVGVNVTEASVMIIEDADRFGISQLHQLRGRLYRGVADNHCVLFSAEPDDNPRLEALAEHDDGFELAEIDLALRREGQLFDTRQSGRTDLKIASLVRDAPLLAAVREEARQVVAVDPELSAHPALAAELRRLYADDMLDTLETG